MGGDIIPRVRIPPFSKQLLAICEVPARYFVNLDRSFRGSNTRTNPASEEKEKTPMRAGRIYVRVHHAEAVSPK